MLRTITIAALCINIEHIGRIFLGDPQRYLLNYGMAFSTFQNMPLMTGVITGLACVFIAFMAFHPYADEYEKVGYAIMLGGALSNFSEKIILGYVIDWIHIPFVPLVINIADIEISLGALIAFLDFFEPIIKLPRQ